jgi:curli biogenesis system outer membrane secretion channel CsgG
MDLQAVGVSQSEALSITNRIRNEVFLTDKYTVLEREAMLEIAQEQGFQLTGCTSSECVVQAGRMLGVQKMVAGSLDKLGELYTINLRLINVETGKIDTVASDDYRGPIEDVAVK